jgi:glycosyltransferase 2 family protein
MQRQSGNDTMKPEIKTMRNVFLRIVMSAGLIGILVYYADLGVIWRLMKEFRIEWVIAVFGAILLSMIISTLKWSALLRPGNCSVSKLSLLRTYLIGLFFNNFLPSSIGGDGIRILITGKQVGRSTAASSIVVERLLATVTLALLGLGCAFFAHNRDSVSIALMGALLVIGLILLMVLVSGRIPRFLRSRNNRFQNAVNSFLAASQKYRNQPQAIGKSMALSLIFQTVVALVVGAVIAGLGLEVPAFADLVYITCAASVLAMIPAGINGYGLREGAFVYLLKPLGFAASSAIAVSVLFAVAVSLFSLSGAVLWLLSRSQRKTSTGVSAPAVD